MTIFNIQDICKTVTSILKGMRKRVTIVYHIILSYKSLYSLRGNVV